jgi:hypothetical protein
MGISKLTCTLKGAVPPKWSLDEDAYVVVGQLSKDLGKLIHHLVPLFREDFHEQQLNRISCSLVSLVLPPWEVVGLERDGFLKRN